MNNRFLKPMAVALVLTAAGLAHAYDNDQDVELRVAEVNTMLSKASVKLAAANAATAPPSACVDPKQGHACAAVSQLDHAHAGALDVLFKVDAIDSGPSPVAITRRLDRVAWTADDNRTLLAGIIGPELAGIIDPEFAGIISPEFAGIISPEVADSVQATSDIIGPEIAGIIDPERTADLVTIIGPEYEGLSSAERDRIEGELSAIIARAQADLVLAYATQRALNAQY